MSLTIYGASDDLVEVDGDVREEFNPDDGASYIAVSDGTVLRITYDGQWHIAAIKQGSATYDHAPATDEDGDPRDDEFSTPSYSDRVILSGVPISWVVFGSHYEAHKP